MRRKGKQAPSSVLAQISLQTGLHVAIPLLKPLKHPIKQFALVLKTSGQVVHVGVGRLCLQPYLGIRAVKTNSAIEGQI